MTEVGTEGASPSSPAPKSGRGRRRGAIALVVVASLLAFPAILAVWANRQVLNTDNWTRTSTQLLENRIIREQVSTYLVDELYANVDVQAELEQALPPRLDPLAGPAAGGLRDLAERTANRVLARPRAQERWADANRAAHAALIRLLEGGGPNVSTEGGVVKLDVRNLVALLTERVGVGGRLQNALPASAAEITVLRSNQLETAQNGLKLMRGLPIVLIGLSFVLFACALFLAPDWRRKALRAYGVGFVAAGVAALLTRSIAGDQVVAALGTTASVQPAIAAAWTIATPLLKQAANATILYGVAMIGAAWLAGPSRPAVAIRTAVAPYARRPAIAYGTLAVVVVLLLLWGPTPATRNPALALILVVLLAIGTELLRRQIIREHPDARRGETMQRVRARAGSTARKSVVWAREGAATGRSALAGTTARVTAFRGEGGADGGDDERIAQLERLARLKESGVLDEQEFRDEKRRILEQPADAKEPEGPDGVGSVTPSPAG